MTGGPPNRLSARADLVKKAVILIAAAGILAWLIWLIKLLAFSA
ncbi:MAG: hypothetical protein U1E43_06865 [Rhodospirillales bacterium]